MCFEPEVIVLLHVKHICCSAIARVGVDAVVFSIGVAIAKGTSAAELLCRRRRRNIRYSSYQIITFCREQVYLTLAYFPNNVTAGGSVRLTCVLPLLLVLASFIQPLASIPFIAIGRSWFLLLVMLRSCLFLLILASCFLLLAFKSFEL